MQRVESGVQRGAAGLSKSIRSRLSRCCTAGDGAHSRALMAKAWSISKVRARLVAETSEPEYLERRLPQGGPECPIIFAMILECAVRRCEEKWAVKGWGL